MILHGLEKIVIVQGGTSVFVSAKPQRLESCRHSPGQCTKEPIKIKIKHILIYPCK